MVCLASAHIHLQKYGGKIIPLADMSQADYIILSPHADTFESQLRQTIILNKPAVQAHFVYGCVEEGVLLDAEEFSFHGVVVKGRKGKPNTTVDLHALREAYERHETKKLGSRKSARKKMKESTSDKRRPHRKTHKPPKQSPDTKPTIKDDSPADHVPRSPSPIPPDDLHIVQFAEGRNRFTPQDEEYFSLYVTHLLKGDPDLSAKQVGDKLAEKVSNQPEYNDIIPNSISCVDASPQYIFVAGLFQ